MRAWIVGDHVMAAGREHVITRRWRDPGMRSYAYEAEPVDAPGHPNTFTRDQLTAVPSPARTQPWKAGDVLIPRVFADDPTYDNRYVVQYAHHDGQLCCTSDGAGGEVVLMQRAADLCRPTAAHIAAAKERLVDSLLAQAGVDQ